MGKTQETWVRHENGQSLHLKHHLQLKTKEDSGEVVWDPKIEECNSHKDGTQGEL